MRTTKPTLGPRSGRPGQPAAFATRGTINVLAQPFTDVHKIVIPPSPELGGSAGSLSSGGGTRPAVLPPGRLAPYHQGPLLFPPGDPHAHTQVQPPQYVPAQCVPAQCAVVARSGRSVAPGHLFGRCPGGMASVGVAISGRRQGRQAAGQGRLAAGQGWPGAGNARANHGPITTVATARTTPAVNIEAETLDADAMSPPKRAPTTLALKTTKRCTLPTRP